MLDDDDRDLALQLAHQFEQACRAFGAEPVMITVIVDRGGTCGAMAEAAGVPFVPMLTAVDLGFGFGT